MEGVTHASFHFKCNESSPSPPPSPQRKIHVYARFSIHNFLFIIVVIAFYFIKNLFKNVKSGGTLKIVGNGWKCAARQLVRVTDPGCDLNPVISLISRNLNSHCVRMGLYIRYKNITTRTRTHTIHIFRPRQLQTMACWKMFSNWRLFTRCITMSNKISAPCCIY